MKARGDRAGLEERSLEEVWQDHEERGYPLGCGDVEASAMRHRRTRVFTQPRHGADVSDRSFFVGVTHQGILSPRFGAILVPDYRSAALGE